MLHRFIETIRRINSQSGFEIYLANLQRHSLIGAPTFEEARKDYQASFKAEARFLAGAGIPK